MNKREREHDTLGNRMKEYESLTTSRRLMPNCPVYARIDGRAFHTLCRGIAKPYSEAFIEVMRETCRFLVEETSAALGYVQSDEISLAWTDTRHCPFDGRIQKLESNLASMASSFFVKYVLTEKGGAPLLDRVLRHTPSFDCRVHNVPSMEELANAFLWRENDAIKNSISGMALNFYSHRELQNKSSDEKIHMMRMKGYCFYEDTSEAFLRGTFLHRETYTKTLSDEEVAKIPDRQRSKLIVATFGDTKTYICYRSHIAEMHIPYRLTDVENKVGVLFGNEPPRLNKDNPTFTLVSRRCLRG